MKAGCVMSYEYFAVIENADTKNVKYVVQEMAENGFWNLVDKRNDIEFFLKYKRSSVESEWKEDIVISVNATNFYICFYSGDVKQRQQIISYLEQKLHCILEEE